MRDWATSDELSAVNGHSLVIRVIQVLLNPHKTPAPLPNPANLNHGEQKGG